MMRVLSGVVAALIGLGLGWGFQRLPGRPLALSVGAMLFGWVLGSVSAATLWILFPPNHLDVLAVSFGLAEGAISALLVCGLALATHAALGWVDHWVVGLAKHRALILGGLGGLLGALAFGSAWGLTRPLG